MQRIENIKQLAVRGWKAILPYSPAIVIGGVMIAILSPYRLPSLAGAEAEQIVIPKQQVEAGETIETKAGVFTQEDGLYIGSGTGFGGIVTVAVQITEGSMEHIWVISSEGEDEAFFNRAKRVIDQMIKNQSTEVDAISGATFSSNGIIEAVKNALSGKVVTASPTPGATTLTKQDYDNLQDGTYLGSAEGFGGVIKVEVVIKEGTIKSITIKEAKGEGADYLKRASVLTKTMIGKQSTNVDAVSGATFTSNGLIQAVRNALKQASGTATAEEEETVEGTMPYPDGVYYGTGTGFAGPLTVAIVVEDKTLKAAIVTESSDDASFLTKAKKILTQAVEKQTSKVDAVSGATYSSKGIIEALRQAFQAAKAAAEGTKQESSKTPAPQKTQIPQNEQETEGKGTYQDGTYAVTVTCNPDEKKAFSSYDLSMKVVIAGDKITAIHDVTGSGSSYVSINDSFISRALSGVESQIIGGSMAEGVDAVSGATCSSNAIVEGCKKALELAKSNTSPTEAPTQKPAASSTPTPAPTMAPTLPPVLAPTATPDNSEEVTSYKDGTYTGSAICSPDWNKEFYAYTLSLKVTVKNNKITAVTDLSGSGSKYDSSNALFFQMAATGTAAKPGVVSQIITSGSLGEIDAISGATCSSKSIVEACSNALESAKE